MRKIERKICIKDLMNFNEGALYGEITATNIYMNIDLVQTVDDMGMFTDLPYKQFGDVCGDLDAIVYIDNITCYNGNLNNAPADGEILIVPYGGLEPYTYLWGFDGSTSNTLSNLIPGSYTVTVTDSYGCPVTKTIDVVALSGADPNVMVTSSAGLLTPNGTNTYELLPDEVVANPIQLCGGETVTFTADGGFLSYIWRDENGNVIGNTPNLTVDTSGTYTLSVVNANGCVGESVPVTVGFIEIVPPVIIPTNFPSTVIGSGTQNYPYIICDPATTTASAPTFELLNPEVYDAINWSSTVINGTSIATVPEPLSCTYDNPCSQLAQVSSICDASTNPNIDSNTIWFVYDGNLIIPPSSPGGFYTACAQINIIELLP